MYLMDSPVSGGNPMAAAGTLAIMTGGDREAYDRVENVLRCMGTPVFVGGPASGSVTKLVNNYATITPQEAEYEVSVIKEQTDVMVSLVDNIIDALQIEAKEFERKYQQGKEVAYEE